MTDRTTDRLGRTIAVIGIAPLVLQRAAFIAILSFLFFLATMIMFYARQSMLYFLLATAFLLVHLATMFSWFTMKKKAVELHENGLNYRRDEIAWGEIASIEAQTTSSTQQLAIKLHDGREIVLPSTLDRLDEIRRIVGSHVRDISS